MDQKAVERFLKKYTPDSSDISMDEKREYLQDAITDGGYYGEDGVWNSIIVFDGDNHIYRGRVETLIIKDGDKIFLRFKDKGNNSKYFIPGGSFEKDIPNIDQAINECKEEARINVRNIRSSGITYKDVVTPPKWAIGTQAVNWNGNYTEVYVGEFDGYYTGHIDEVDEDKFMVKGKFYPIAEVYEVLKKEHKEAIKNVYPNLDEKLHKKIYHESVRFKSVDNKDKDAMKTIINSLKSDDFNGFSEDLNSNKIFYYKIQYDRNNPVGFCIAINEGIENKKRVASLSVAVNPDYRKKGIAKSLSRQAIQYIRTSKEFDRIYWGYKKSNDGSKKLAENLGFTYGGNYNKSYEYFYKDLNASTLNESGFITEEDVYSNFSDIEKICSSLSKSDLNRISKNGKYENSENVIYRYIERIGNIPVGFIDIYWYEKFSNLAYIILAVNPKYRGKGIASKMIQTAIDSGIDKRYNFKEYIWHVDEDNIASQKLAEKNGFVTNGVLNKKKRWYEYKLRIYRINEAALNAEERRALPSKSFGIPSLRKFPLNDRDHVLQAIRFFNTVDKKHEKELARNIIKAMKRYKISKQSVGDRNRLRTYLS